MKLKLILIANLIFCVLTITAQKRISNVININPNNIQPIKKGEKISGYYMFYKADKVKGKEYSYRLRILDENLEKVAEKRITATENLHLLEAQYNQELLCFKFIETKEKKIMFKMYNNLGEKVSSKSYEADKLELKLAKVAIMQNVKQEPSLYAIPNQGFINVRIVKNDKPGFEIRYYPNDKTQKSWKFYSKKTSPIMEWASIMQANENIIVASVALKKSRTSKDAEYQILGIDPKTGKELFKSKLENSKYEESVTNSFYDPKKKEIHLFGFYFAKGEKTDKANSLGMSKTIMSLDGKIISKKNISWARDVSKLISASERGKIKDVGYIYFHEFIQKEDGSIYAIGEQFKKTVSAAGTASQILSIASAATGNGGGGMSSASQMTVGDFYFLKFDKEFNLKEIKIFEKSTSRVALPAGASYYGPQILAKFVDAVGGFDYNYIKTLDGGKTFSVYYRNYEKRKKEKNKSVCGVISNTDGEYLADKVDIPTEADYVKVMPAQGSNVLFFEYYRKEKQLKMRFQKMNY